MSVGKHTLITLTLALVLSWMDTLKAQTIDYSVDIWTVLDGQNAADEDIVSDPLDGNATPANSLAIPHPANLAGLERAADGDWLFAVDITIVLGGATVTQLDVVRFDGASYSVEFDGSANGLPGGSAIDAVSLDGTDLILSFDTTIDFQTFVAHDEDLVRFNGQDFSLELDGSTAGLSPAADIDAVHRLDDGTFLISLATHGEVDGIAFADEDVLALDAGGTNWMMSFDGSALHPGLNAADLDAFTTPPSGPGDVLFQDGFENVVARTSVGYVVNGFAVAARESGTLRTPAV